MKTKIILCFLIIPLFLITFSIFLFSCSDGSVTCINGGYISGSSCVCPAGYGGRNCENTCPAGYNGLYCDNPVSTSSIMVYKNNTHTDIIITINATPRTIPTGHNFPVSCSIGTANLSTGLTYGVYGGDIIPYNRIDSVLTPMDTIQLDVPAGYCYLYIKNSSSYTIGSVYANYGIITELEYFPTSLAPIGTFIGFGYFKQYSNSNLRLINTAVTWMWNFDMSALPIVPNQTYSVTCL